MASKPKSSEVDAYIWIKTALKELKWDTRNPLKSPAGQVYTQSECTHNQEIKLHLGLEKPENIVKVSETDLWVIEAKRERTQLDQAVGEAEDYAQKINKSKILKARLISGVAGNDPDDFLVKTRLLVGGSFITVTINGREATALLAPDVVRRVLQDGPEIKDVPVDEELFLKRAERINEHLHLGAINKNVRARVMAALLLALSEGTPPDVNEAPAVLIESINSKAKHVLAKQNKEAFYQYIAIAPPPSTDNHVKFKKALVQTIQELLRLNIRSAMNSGADVLGKFYEVFLKYGNGAKEIGIVLTPRHVTKFAVEVLGVSDRDVIYDPTCGTGGFLVAAFDHVRMHYSKEQVNRFKQNHLFGVEQETEVVALALVNMIFRGDGKNNIIDGNCFQKNIVRTPLGGEFSSVPATQENRAVTRVFMNPPFALKDSTEKEYKFVDHALEQMEDSALLFAVLPYSAMVKPGGYQGWRRSTLLAKHTLLGVMTLPEDLFYPVGVHTVGVFVKKGIPHPKEQNVLWVRAIHDGLLKSKGKRLPNPKVSNDLEAVKNLVKAFIANPAHPIPNIDRFQKACPIDYSDPLLELVPENYLDQAPPTDEEIRIGIDQLIRDSIAFMIRSGRED